MKKLLSILASLGLAATASAGVVACADSDKGGKTTNQISSVTFDYSKLEVTVKLESTTTEVINENTVHINNNVTVLTATLQTDKKTILITVKDDSSIHPTKTTKYTVTIDGINSSASNTFTINGSSPINDNTVSWTTDNIVFSDNKAQWVAVLGSGIKNEKPLVTCSSPNANVIKKDSVNWDSSLKQLSFSLDDNYNNGLPSGSYTFTVVFKTIDGADISSTIHAKKTEATKSESTMIFKNDTSDNDTINNQVSWTYTSVGNEIDLAKEIKVTSEKPGVVKNYQVDIRDKKVIVTLEDGLAKDKYSLNITFAMRNGFTDKFPTQVFANKSNVTQSESKYSWKDNGTEEIDLDNKATFQIDLSQNNGAEINFENKPTLKAKNGTPLIKDTKWQSNSKSLIITVNDNLAAGDYQVDASFVLKQGWGSSTNLTTTLTLKKAKPSKVEGTISTVKPDGTVNQTGGVANSVEWNIDTIGYDVDDSTIAKAIIDKQENPLNPSAFVFKDHELTFMLGTYQDAGTHTIELTFNYKNGFTGTVTLNLTYTLAPENN